MAMVIDILTKVDRCEDCDTQIPEEHTIYKCHSCKKKLCASCWFDYHEAASRIAERKH